MVLAIILFMGAVSGAHLNPAVSIAFALRRDFPWKRVPAYIVAQFLGSGAGDAACSGRSSAPRAGRAWRCPVLASPRSAPCAGRWCSRSGWSAPSSGPRPGSATGPMAAIGVGSYIALAGLWGAPVSGASMNPARLGPALGAHQLDRVVGVPGRADGRGGPRRRHGVRPRGPGGGPAGNAGRPGHPGHPVAPGADRGAGRACGPPGGRMQARAVRRCGALASARKSQACSSSTGCSTGPVDARPWA